MSRYFLSLALLLILALSSRASDTSRATSDLPDRTIIVGVKHSPPFMIKSERGFQSGVSHDLWEDIAEDLDLNYEYKEYDLVGLLNAVEKGEIDICINPLTVTSERLQRMDFSQPFYTSNLAIAVPYESESDILLFLSNIFSLDFLSAVLLLIIVIFIFGFLLWLVEKRANPEMFGSGWKGVLDGFWWSAVTMTTVGYGDKVPKSTPGKVIATVWMFTAVIIISSFTASIASSLTVQKTGLRIQSLKDLKDVRCATVEGSNSAKFLRERSIPFITYPSLEKGLTNIDEGNLDAFVYDEPLLRYVIRNQGMDNNVKVLSNTFNKQHYSFAFPKGSSLTAPIELELLEELESENWTTILRRYELNR